MKTGFKILCLLIVLLQSWIANAGQGTDALDAFLASTQTIEARFQQKLLDNKGILLQQSAGKFTLKRPGKFIWDYVLPYPQKIVSNAKRIWVFDSELAQVTIKQYSDMLSGAPVALLDQRKKLADDFVVTDAGSLQGQDWVKLTPRSAESEFTEIYVGMSKNNLKSMRLIDSFGQSTTIEFEQLQTNTSLDDAVFEFKPPAGVDVVGQ
ncbi:MAG: outer rane lipoprotein carrier protein [Pseudomonadota bacterium]|nr:outer rane lipoprotein carrier protein [Pseudomonadota bacterium]